LEFVIGFCLNCFDLRVSHGFVLVGGAVSKLSFISEYGEVVA